MQLFKLLYELRYELLSDEKLISVIVAVLIFFVTSTVYAIFLLDQEHREGKLNNISFKQNSSIKKETKKIVAKVKKKRRGLIEGSFLDGIGFTYNSFYD